MPLGRPKVARRSWLRGGLILTDEERVRLDSLSHRSRTAPSLARRARIILACAEGHDSKVVARRLRLSPTTVCKWRGRFVRERVEGLYDEPRPGAPRRVTDEEVERVIVRTLEETPRGATHWSVRGMAHASGLGRTTVQQIWRAFGLQPHRDGRHKTPLIRHWFAKRPRFHVHFTPTYGSWLNLVERWFAELTNKQLRRGVHRSVAQLKAAIRDFIAAHHAAPKPFVWTKSVEEIFASIARLAQRTLDRQAAPLIARTTRTGH